MTRCRYLLPTGMCSGLRSLYKGPMDPSPVKRYHNLLMFRDLRVDEEWGGKSYVGPWVMIGQLYLDHLVDFERVTLISVSKLSDVDGMDTRMD